MILPLSVRSMWCRADKWLWVWMERTPEAFSSPSEHLLGPLFESMYKSKVSSEGI